MNFIPRTNFSRFFLFFLIISIFLPLIILGGASLFISSRVLTDELTLADMRQVRLIAENVEHTLTDPETILNLMIHQMEMDSYIESDDIYSLLESFADTYDFIYGIQIADENAIVTTVYPEDPLILGSDVSGHNYIREVINKGIPYWAPSSISEQLDTAVASLSIPLDEGVLTAFLSLDRINSILTDNQFTDSRIFAYVTDQKGVFISHPDRSKVLLQEYDPFFNISKKERRGNEYSSVFEYEGKLYNVYSIIIEPSQWMVALYQSQDIIENPVRNMAYWLLVLTLIISVIALSFGNFLRKSITDPLNIILNSTREIASGQYDITIPEVSFTELSLLAESIELMAADIENREDALKKTKTYLINILDSMPSMLIGVNTDMVITQWNKQSEYITGIKLKDALGRKLDDAAPRLKSYLEDVYKAISHREKQIIRNQFSTIDGETNIDDITIYPLIADGVGGAVIRIDNVTDKIYMEEMMIQNEKMLSVGGLAAGMAHEINNPLAGMIQTANVMANRLGLNKKFPSNARAAEAAGISMDALLKYLELRDIYPMLKKINESGERMSVIVNNMLSFARSGVASHDPYFIRDLIDKTIELAGTDYNLKKRYDFREIKIIRNYEANVPAVTCDKSKIQQVFYNIFQNGAHAMYDNATKKPQFIVNILYLDNKDQVSIEIIDNGPGIEEKVRKRIFEPFFTTKPEGVGTGLGLSVSYFIVNETCKGDLSVQSTPGEGTKFTINLPALKKEA